METEVLTVTQFHEVLNQTLEFAYPAVVIEGEVSSFKINQGKWVFFDLKDDQSTISCFMTIYNLKVPLEDGMLIKVVASPNLTKWGKFSLTVKQLELSGEGTVKKAFELLKAQFEKEGLFDPARKRPLPRFPARIALITSRQAAAFNDFIKVLNDRWSGVAIDQAQVQVQGLDAPRQICRAINYFNDRASKYDVMVLIRGGGSSEDLQAFSSEDVVRAVYGAKIPTIVGIGHEDDVSLAELSADVRAATPTDAARRVVPDKTEIILRINSSLAMMEQAMQRKLTMIENRIERVNHAFGRLYSELGQKIDILSMRNQAAIMTILDKQKNKILALTRVLAGLDPRAILARGYSIASVGGQIVTRADQIKQDSQVVLQLHQGKVNLIRSVARKNTSPQRKERLDEQNSQTRLRI